MSDADVIAAVIAKAVKASTAAMAESMAGMQTRMDHLETQMAAHADAMAACQGRLDTCESRLMAMEAAMPKALAALEMRLQPELSDADLALVCEELTRKAFETLPPPVPPRRMQKRVIRDADGKIHKIVEEPAAP